VNLYTGDIDRCHFDRGTSAGPGRADSAHDSRLTGHHNPDSLSIGEGILPQGRRTNPNG